MTSGMNRLQVGRVDFVDATKVFRPRIGTRPKAGQALLAFDGRFLSIEFRGVAAVMHAAGEWHGLATFSGVVLHALAMHPPTHDPLILAYADEHLLIAGMTIPCGWTVIGRTLVETLENPDLLGILALETTLSRAEARSAPWRSRLGAAVKDRNRRIRLAARHLGELGISDADIRTMVDARVGARIDSASAPAIPKR